MIAQEPVRVSQVVRHAVQFNARHWRSQAMSSDVMPQAVGDLFHLLDQRGIDYVLVGGIALLSYVEGRNTTVQRFDEREITTATVEGLLLLKLYVLPSLYRQGNFARGGLYENDVATLLYYYQPDQEAILRELASHLSASDLARVRGILADLAQRIQRFDTNGRA